MRIFVLACAALAALSVTASAQTPPFHLPNRPIPMLIARATGDTSATITHSFNVVTTAPSTPITSTAALASFRLNFENGDHKIKRMLVQADANGMARFSLNDRDFNDPYAASAVWINIVGGQAGEVTGYGAGTIQIPIPPGPANHTFALRGFSLERRSNVTDANVRSMSIRLAPNGAAIDVALTDDQRADFRVQASGPTCPGCGTRHPYTAIIQYVWIPNALITTQGSITGNEFGREQSTIASGFTTIRGFSFEFQNSDHFIAHVEASTSGGGLGRFQDVNAGDPMRWQIDYATIREPH